MSALALSKETHPAAELGLDISGLTDSNTPLIVNDAQVVPAGSNRFSKTETAIVYFEVYSRDAGSVKAQMRVAQRKANSERLHAAVALGAPKPGSETIPTAFRMPIEGLDIGPYTVTVSIVDAAGKQLTRSADFEIY